MECSSKRLRDMTSQTLVYCLCSKATVFGMVMMKANSQKLLVKNEQKHLKSIIFFLPPLLASRSALPRVSSVFKIFFTEFNPQLDETSRTSILELHSTLAYQRMIDSGTYRSTPSTDYIQYTPFRYIH